MNVDYSLWLLDKIDSRLIFMTKENDNSLAYLLYKNFKSLSSSLVDVVGNNILRRKSTISANVRIVKPVKEDLKRYPVIQEKTAEIK